MSKITTSYKAIFRPSIVEGHPGSIFYQVIHRRKVRQITTRYKVHPHEWNNDRGHLIIAEGAYRANVLADIARNMDWDLERLSVIISRLDNNHRDYTVDDVVREYQVLSSRSKFFVFMDEVITRLGDLGKRSLVVTYTATLRSFKCFRANMDLPLNHITPELMEEYQSWLSSRGVVMNTVSFYTRILRAVYNRAVNMELVTDCHPFRRVYTGVAKTVKRAISATEIKRIADLNLSHHPALEQARDIFMMLFCLRGMSMIDLIFLKKSNLQAGVLCYHRHKTGQLLTIKWEQPMADFLTKYSTSSSEYLFSFISSNSTDPVVEYKRILRNTNANLKKVAKLAGLQISLSTYVSRHTWASIAREKSIPISVISECMGHDSELTTQIYLASIDTSSIDSANSLVISSIFDKK